MSDARDLIARCTRNGVISWQQVAKQLGCSVDRAQRMYATTPRQDPQQLAELLTNAEAYKSPHPKGDGLKAAILGLLERHGQLSVADIAARTRSTPATVRGMLRDLTHAGLVENDQARMKFERSWKLTATGRTIAKTQHTRPGDVGPRTPSAIGEAA